MSYIAQQSDIDILFQSNKIHYVKIQLLNNNYKTVEEIQGYTVDGNFSVDANSDIRRTINITLQVSNSSFILGADNEVWLDKYIRVYDGYKYLRDQIVHWYPCGIYVFDNSNKEYSLTSNTLALSCSDLMSKLTGSHGGEMSAESIVIPVNTNIRTAIKDIITGAGFTKYLLTQVRDSEDNIRLTPYELTFSNGTSNYEIIKKLRDLYFTYETFFDEYGTFVFQNIPDCSSDSITINLDDYPELVISKSRNVDLTRVRNKITVWGKDGINATASDTNSKSPFAISKIGERHKPLYGEDFEKIMTEALCLERAKYELWKYTRLEDNITLNMVNIPWLDVNKKIGYTYDPAENQSEYIIKKIDRDLSSGTMTVNMIKFYSLYPYIV